MTRALIFLAALAFAAFPAAAQFSFLGLKNELIDFALEQISVPGELEITAEGVEDGEDGALEIVGLSVADGEGVWMSVERLTLAWTPSRILRGELAIQNLEASGVDVRRPPSAAASAVEVKENSALAQTDDDPFDWPRAPIATVVERLALTGVRVAPGVMADVGIAFDAAGALRDEGDEQSLTFALRRIDGVEGAIDIDFLRDFAADALRLKMTAEEAPGGLVAALAGFADDTASRVAIEGDGPVAEWAVKFDASSTYVFDARGDARISLTDRIAASADFSLTPGASLDPALQRALAPQARLNVAVAENDAGVIRIENGALTSRDVSLVADGTFDRATTVSDFAVKLEIDGALSELIEGAAFDDIGFDGAVTGPTDDLAAKGRLSVIGFASSAADIGEASLDAEIAVVGERVDLNVDGAVGGLRLDRLTPEIIGDAELAIRGTYQGSEALLETLSLTARPLDLSVTGAVDLKAETASIEYALKTPNLAPIAAAYGADAAGRFAATGALDGPLAAARLVGEAKLTDLRFQAEDFGAVVLTHDAIFGATPAGDVALAATGSRFGDVSVATEFRLEGDELSLAGATANALGANATGALAVDLAQMLATGEVALKAPDLAPLGAAVGLSLTGALTGDLRLTKEAAGQNAAFDVALRRLGGFGGMAASVAARGSAADLTGGDPSLSAALTIARADFGDVAIGSATARAEGRLGALALSAEAQGAVGEEELSLATRAAANLSGPTQRATVSQLDVSLGEIDIALQSPLSIEASGGATRFTGVDLAALGGGLSGDATLYGDGVAGALTLAVADLTTAAAAFDAPVDSGALNASASFDTRAARAFADIDLDARGLRFSEAIGDAGALALTATVDWNGRAVSADAAISGPFGDPLRISVSTPMRPSGGIAPVLPPNGALTGSVDWVGDIGEFWALVPAPGHVLDGETNVALDIAGTTSAPEFGGEVSIAEGRYENLDAGTILVDLALASRIAPGGAFAVDISAEDGSGGPVAASVSLADGAVDATLSATEATLVRRDDVTAVVSLDIAASGPLAGPTVSGRVLIDRAEVRLVSATPPSVADLGPVRIKGEEPEPESDGAGAAVALDIKVEAPNAVFVRGRGLDSEWMIDLDIAGSAAAPAISGQVEKRRGVLTFLGAPLELERGTVRFLKRNPPDPRLDILLERENDGVTGGIAVTGDASAPEINFVSRPALPEDEVLPRILFGQSSQSLSPSQAISLAIGLATLLDGTGGATDDVRSAVGVDVLRIEQGEDGPAVTVGTNIVDGVFVGTTQPVGGGSAKVQVEIEVFDDFTIDSETGADVGSSIGLNWKRDF